MNSRLVSFLEYNDVFYTSQFGFRKGKVISTAILTFTESIPAARDNKEQSVGFSCILVKHLLWLIMIF